MPEHGVALLLLPAVKLVSAGPCCILWCEFVFRVLGEEMGIIWEAWRETKKINFSKTVDLQKCCCCIPQPVCCRLLPELLLCSVFGIWLVFISVIYWHGLLSQVCKSLFQNWRCFCLCLLTCLRFFCAWTYLRCRLHGGFFCLWVFFPFIPISHTFC